MKPKFCAICKQQIGAVEDKILVEKHTLHKRCFNCAICDTSLMAGNCSIDDTIFQYFGPLWFCPAHKMLGSGEKLERLKAKYGDPGQKEKK
ncbi:hypothetical protein ACQ4LE_004671 [Meloidogyne hapla]|uniref:LIM zinc-binding domain-containing protein n=1 Tax=Meloidogyne hapla TaxID=6305 RepID=A0A1I8AZK5_MELHA